MKRSGTESTAALVLLPAAGPLLALAGACSAWQPSISQELLEASLQDPVPAVEWHRGPDVWQDGTGPARFVSVVHGAFDVERAMGVVRYADGFYRAPANAGYDAVMDRVAEELRSAGFGSDERLLLEIFETPRNHPAWNPKSGLLELIVEGRDDVVLHAFDDAAGIDRVMLPTNTPACDVRGPVCLSLADLVAGGVLVTEAPARQVLERARSRGAVAVVSASLQDFNTDPAGGDRHLDAIQFRVLRPGTDMPIIQISPRSYRTIEEAARSGKPAELHVKADVEFAPAVLRTLVATIVGDEKPEEAVVIVSHVQEPGACDNASGVAGLTESARSLAELLKKGDLDWPARSMAFVCGDEFVQSEVWLENSGRRAVVGISSDMTGESHERTGAIALLERMPDPGALMPLEPDRHTPWGAGEVTAEDVVPNGLAVIARCAMIDVGLLEGGWISADHPWEGGSDHDVFKGLGIPAVLFWHFTDFSYHTSLDRVDMVDPGEIRRTAAAILATALAVADPDPGDLKRYLESLQAERSVRTTAAQEAQAPEIAEAWSKWCLEARHWLRELCLELDETER